MSVVVKTVFCNKHKAGGVRISFAQQNCRAKGFCVEHGEFGADMQVSLVNEGPCTIVIDTDEWTHHS